MVNFKEIYHISRFQRGSNIFQGGSNCLFPIETHITCDFPGGWIRTCVAQLNFMAIFHFSRIPKSTQIKANNIFAHLFNTAGPPCCVISDYL